MDVIVAYPLSEEAYHLMKWNGMDLYRSAHRVPFYVNDRLHGLVQYYLQWTLSISKTVKLFADMLKEQRTFTMF